MTRLPLLCAREPSSTTPAAGSVILAWVSLITVALVLAPIAAVVFNIFLPSQATWSHLVSTVLPEYIVNTLLLLVLVAAGLIARRDLRLAGYRLRFPWPSALEWALVLPLAIPAYVMAYAYTDWLQAAGPVQTYAARIHRLAGARVLVSGDPLIAGRRGDAVFRALSLCLPAGAQRVP